MEILEQRIKYGDKTYVVGEPTLDIYMSVQKELDYSSDFELAVNMIRWTTGLTEEEIRDAEAYGIMSVAEQILNYYNEVGDKFYNEFEFNGKQYKFIDLKNMSFGEYIDIDTFLQKPNSVKQTKLNELMAMLFRELDNEGNYKPYNVSEIKKTAEEFRKLPLKYFNGSLVFFYLIDNTSLKPTPLYLWRVRLTKTWTRVLTKIKTLLGGTQP